MTTTATPSTIDRATTFLKSVQRNVDKDNAAKAALKRALTGEARHLRAVYPIVLRSLSGTDYNQNEWIFVACLLAYYPQPLDRDKPCNFGQSAGVLASKTDSEGADRRFRALLDTSLEDLRSPLSALVRLMKSKDIAIDYPKLIVDLCRWEHPDQYIQDQWARAFWGAPEPPKEKQEASDEIEELG